MDITVDAPTVCSGEGDQQQRRPTAESEDTSVVCREKVISKSCDVHLPCALHGHVGCGGGADVCGKQSEGEMSAQSMKSRMVVVWPCAPVTSKGTVRD